MSASSATKAAAHDLTPVTGSQATLKNAAALKSVSNATCPEHFKGLTSQEGGKKYADAKISHNAV